jgi:molybdopterin molybdotransferase
MSDMIPVETALDTIRKAIGRLPEEAVPLSIAFGRVLARDLAADRDFPPFETTAMDGYALGGLDPARWRARPGAVAAGDPMPGELLPGEAVRVMTGGPVPQGTSAILPIEQARIENAWLRSTGPIEAGAHLRRRGEVLRKGEVLLRAGDRLSPEAILLAATVGADPAPAVRLPRCAVAVTGSELVAADSRPGPTQIRNGNGPALLAAFARRGVAARELAPMPDRKEALTRLFEESSGFDLLVTTGGVSVGDFDVTPEAAQESGFEILFHGVAIKPGKPVAFGRRQSTFWLGLPGNPLSALTTFELFGGAALERCSGGRAAERMIRGRLSHPARSPRERDEFADARISEVDGEIEVELLGGRGSHDVRSPAGRNGLAVLPSGGGAQAAGDLVSCLLLGAIEPGPKK